jgi:hypothetical protein
MKKTTRLLLALFATAAVPALTAIGLAHAQPDEGHHRKPPPAAFDACKGKKADEACEVTFGERKMTGKCASMPDGMVCRPDHPMGPPPEMLAACEKKKEGEACKATMGEHSVEGTCQKSRRGDHLICRK